MSYRLIFTHILLQKCNVTITMFGKLSLKCIHIFNFFSQNGNGHSWQILAIVIFNLQQCQRDKFFLHSTTGVPGAGLGGGGVPGGAGQVLPGGGYGGKLLN